MNNTAKVRLEKHVAKVRLRFLAKLYRLLCREGRSLVSGEIKNSRQSKNEIVRKYFPYLIHIIQYTYYIVEVK